MLQNKKLIDHSIDVLQQCSSALESIATTCCMPERSPNMQQAQKRLDEMSALLAKSNSELSSTTKIKNDIGELGSQLGFLYATCCTASRESQYQFLFQQLMILNTNMWALEGHTH